MKLGVTHSKTATWRVRLSGMARGYTFIEVMVVMAVTSVLLLAAILTFSGRIQRTQFQQSVRALDLRINDVFNEVGSGNFTNKNTYTCTVSGNNPVISNGSNEQGTNSACIFMGKVIHLGVNEVPNCTTTQNIECDVVEFLSIVGRRRLFVDGKWREVVSLDEANPVVITPLNESYETGYGLSVQKVVAGGNDIAAIGVFSPLAQYNDTAAQQLTVVPVYGTQLGQAAGDLDSAIQGVSEADSKEKITICLTGAGGQEAAIVVNNQNRDAATDMLFEGSIPGECS